MLTPWAKLPNNWGGCSQHRLPSSFDSGADKPRACIEPFVPVVGGESFPIDSYPANIRPVSCLISFGQPAAILWAIVLAGVDAIKRESRWAFGHVVDKVLRRFKPAITHGDPLASIPFVLGAVGLIAPSNHILPRIVEGVSEASVLGNSFDSFASAGLAGSAFDAVTNHVFDNTAVTLERPIKAPASMLSSDWLYGNELIKSLPCDIFNLTHVSSSLIDLVREQGASNTLFSHHTIGAH